MEKSDRGRRYQEGGVAGSRNTFYWPRGYEGIKIISCLRPAPILQAIFATAKLCAFWCVNAPEPYARAVDLERIAVDNGGLAGQVERRRGCSDKE
jgi:hypothetical protein